MTKRNLFTFFSMLFMLSTLSINAQQNIESPEMIATAVAHRVIGPLSDFPDLSPEELAAMAAEEAQVKRNKDLKIRNYPFYEQYKNEPRDIGLQKTMGTKSTKGILQNWTAQSTYSNPPDDNGAAGPDHYMQTINVRYAIYDKVGSLMEGPTNLNAFFTGLPGGSSNDGDPIVLYDEQAERWLMAEFSAAGSLWSPPDYMLIAISQTSDPTGMWDAWSFVMNGFPDYMKFGVWRDGYYMGTNTSSGSDIYVFERDEMLAGGASPQMVQFNNPNRPNSGFHCVLPVDNDGAFAPSGTPGMFMTINDNAWGGSTNDQLWLFELDVDWDTPTNSTFSRVQTIDVASFDSNFGSTWENIVQPGTGQKLDAISQILMHRVQYRNFGTSQNIVCNHTIDVGGNQAGIRWYELEYNGTDWDIRQFGTYAPDGDSRWMGSIAMNGNREIALGYSISSSTTYPGIRYTGQSQAENIQATGIMDIEETSVYEGTSSQTSSERWGDYSNLSIDASNDHTFWFTTQYNINSSQKGTKVVSFEFEVPPLVADFEADDTNPEAGQEVYFTDLSTGNPDTWLWTFTPNTVNFSQFTNGNAPNPVVIFNEGGNYTVELTVTNSNGSNTVTKTDYINASEGLATTATASPDAICLGESTQLNANPTGGSGSYTYSWTSDPEGFTSSLQNPVASPEENITYYVEVFDGTYSANAEVAVTVNPLPEITLIDWPESLCNVGVPPVQLLAAPTGGTYSGPGVSVNGVFISSLANIGWNVIIYTYEDPNGCSNTAMDSIYVDNCVGVSETGADEPFVNLYPNPNMGSFTLDSEQNIDKIEIIDQNGRMVMMRKINDKTTPISALRSKGLYFIRVYIESQGEKPEVITKEFIIK